jgi:alpha-galactosidase
MTERRKCLKLEKLDLDLLDHVRSRIEAPPVPGRTADGNPIAIAGQHFDNGFGVRGIGRLELALDGRARELRATVGVTDDSPEQGPVWFEVIGDGRMLYESRAVELGDPAQQLLVELTGITKLVLTVQMPQSFEALTAWVDGKIVYKGRQPEAVRPALEPPYILTPDAPVAPRINEPTVFGVRPGSPLLYTVPASGQRPMRFSATGLPAGLSMDPANGRVTGIIAEAGEYPIKVTAENSHGRDIREIILVAGEKLALTPPMGWNSWYCLGDQANAGDVLEMARAIVQTGLDQYGYSYVTVDDFWTNRPLPDDPVWEDVRARAKELGYTQPKIPQADDPTLIGPARSADGPLQPNRRFPNMAQLVEEIHSLGLKAGIYSSPGILSCGLCAGSLGHEEPDAKQFADWKFDLLKYDFCSYRYFVSRRTRYMSGAEDIPREELQAPYARMGKALRAQPRDIVYSLCQYGLGSVWEWGEQVEGNCWRTGRDLTDSWSSISGAGFMQNGHEPFAGPGHWNDLDMLMLGRIWWGENRRQTRLSPDEQYTYVSLWALQASPLIIGCDIREMDDFTFSLLANNEVIAVNQDRLGRAARRVALDRNLQVWARPLSDGSLAAGLFNRGEIPAEVTARWSALGIKVPCRVRDLWRQRDLGEFNGEYTARVPRHGVALIRLVPAQL